MTVTSLRHATPPIHVLVFTSPIPSNPSTAILDETLESVVERLPGCQVTVLADGVRPEQKDRRFDYEDAIHTAWKRWVLNDNKIAIREFRTHQHQSGMLLEALHNRHTTEPWLLIVEHDAPLVGDPIPWWELIEAADNHNLNVIRFMHEANILDEHRYLFDGEVFLGGPGMYLAPTRQFSMRPHLARTDWYLDVLARYFTPESRCFVEDVVYSPGTTGELGGMAVYLPDPGGNGNKRSTHLDGRCEDPKYPQWDDVHKKIL